MFPGNTEPITIITPPGRDPYGDPLPEGGVQTVVEDCLFAPGASRELDVNANQVEADATVFAPPGTPVTATDQVLVRGLLYEVAAQPRVWLDALVEIPVRRVTG